MRTLAGALLVLLLLLCTAGPAGADQKEQARQLFDRGMDLYNKQKYNEAAVAFGQAYQVFPQPAFLYNIAQAHRLAGHDAEALAFYKNYLRSVPDAKNRAEVEGRIAALAGDKVAVPQPLPQARPVREPRSQHGFPSALRLGDRDYTLVGAGARTTAGALLYGVGLYVEDEPARRAFPRLVQAAGGKELRQLVAADLAQDFVARGAFGKLAILYFPRDVSAQQLRESYRAPLRAALAGAPPLLTEHAAAFLALFSRDMKAGEELRIAAGADGQLRVAVDAGERAAPADVRLAQEVWRCWLGQKPVSRELKQDLVRRIATLGQ